jgi:hypothetical protein
LRDLLRQVIRAREPDVLPVLDDPAAAKTFPVILSNMRSRPSASGCS